MKNILLVHNLLENVKKDSFIEIIREFLKDCDKIYTSSKFLLSLRGFEENNKIQLIQEEDLFYYLNKCDSVIYGLDIKNITQENKCGLTDIIAAAKDTNKNYMIVSL